MNRTAPRVDAYDIQHFLAFGFVHLRGWLTAEEVATLRAEAEQVLRDEPTRPLEVAGVPMHYQQATLMTTTTPLSMSLLVDDPRFLDAATALLGGPVVPRPAKVTRHMGDTGWHTDYPSDRLRTWLGFGHYFEPLTYSTGALRFLPATHLLPSFEAFDRYLAEHCPRSSRGIEHIGGQAIETQPGDVIAKDGRGLHASRGGNTRLRWSLGYRLEPATPEEITDHRDSFPEHAYTDWIANHHQHPARAAMITRMTQLDLLRIAAPSARHLS